LALIPFYFVLTIDNYIHWRTKLERYNDLFWIEHHSITVQSSSESILKRTKIFELIGFPKVHLNST